MNTRRSHCRPASLKHPDRRGARVALCALVAGVLLGACGYKGPLGPPPPAPPDSQLTVPPDVSGMAPQPSPND